MPTSSAFFLSIQEMHQLLLLINAKDTYNILFMIMFICETIMKHLHTTEKYKFMANTEMCQIWPMKSLTVTKSRLHVVFCPHTHHHTQYELDWIRISWEREREKKKWFYHFDALKTLKLCQGHQNYCRLPARFTAFSGQKGDSQFWWVPLLENKHSLTEGKIVWVTSHPSIQEINLNSQK